MKKFKKLIFIIPLVFLSTFLSMSMKTGVLGNYKCLIKSDVSTCSPCTGDAAATVTCSPGDCECANQKCMDWIMQGDIAPCDWNHGINVCSATCNDIGLLPVCYQIMPSDGFCDSSKTTVYKTIPTTTEAVVANEKTLRPTGMFIMTVNNLLIISIASIAVAVILIVKFKTLKKKR